MRSLALALGLALIPLAAHADALLEQRLSKIIAPRDPKLVWVLSHGSLYHRYDHLALDDCEGMMPSQAELQNYTPCPECQPPETDKQVAEEIKKGRTLTEYYRTYLHARTRPISDQVPPGADLRGVRLPSQGGGATRR